MAPPKAPRPALPELTDEDKAFVRHVVSIVAKRRIDDLAKVFQMPADQKKWFIELFEQVVATIKGTLREPSDALVEKLIVAPVSKSEIYITAPLFVVGDNEDNWNDSTIFDYALITFSKKKSNNHLELALIDSRSVDSEAEMLAFKEENPPEQESATHRPAADAARRWLSATELSRELPKEIVSQLRTAMQAIVHGNEEQLRSCMSVSPELWLQVHETVSDYLYDLIDPPDNFMAEADALTIKGDLHIEVPFWVEGPSRTDLIMFVVYTADGMLQLDGVHED